VAAVLAVSSPQPASVAAMAMTKSVFMMDTIGGNGRQARQQIPPLPCGRTEKVKAAGLDASSVGHFARIHAGRGRRPGRMKISSDEKGRRNAALFRS
jgi:hypothetical protein